MSNPKKELKAARVAGEPKREKFLKVRCTDDEYQEVQRRAEAAGMNMSDFLRSAAFTKKIIGRDAGALVGELRKIGALIKHNYPAVKSWSDEEKKRYWNAHERLWELAGRIAVSLGLKKSS